MAHFLSTETLPSAPHVLASVQPRGTHRVATEPGAERGTEDDIKHGYHFNTRLRFPPVMPCAEVSALKCQLLDTQCPGRVEVTPEVPDLPAVQKIRLIWDQHMAFGRRMVNVLFT